MSRRTAGSLKGAPRIPDFRYAEAMRRSHTHKGHQEDRKKMQRRKSVSDIPIAVLPEKKTPYSMTSAVASRRSSAVLPPKQAPPLSSSFVRSERVRSIPKAIGLYNVGNTCYMNSALQVLCRVGAFTRPFLKWLTRSTSEEAKSGRTTLKRLGKASLTIGFAKLLEQLFESQRASISPQAFKDLVDARTKQFRGHKQHDSHEFLQFLLEQLHEEGRSPTKQSPTLAEHMTDLAARARLEWKRHFSNQKSVVFHSFYGQFHTCVQCSQCSITSDTFDVCAQLTLDLPPFLRKERWPTLEQCMETSFRSEVLQGSNAWRCPRCNTLRRATKKVTFRRLPPVLMVQLKRFDYSTGRSRRVNTPITYPLRLEMAPYLSPLQSKKQSSSASYQLAGIVCHSGDAGGGHYTAIATADDSDGVLRWHLFDDSHTLSIRREHVLGYHNPSAAYILFYQRLSRQKSL